MDVGTKFKDTFYNTKPLSEQDYEHSRKIAIYEGCTARAVFNLTSGAFLAGYASFLGADDAFNGIIGAIPVLAGVISILSPIYFEKRDKRKLQVVVLNFLHRFILGLMGFIPLIAAGRTPRLMLMASFYMLAYLAVSFANPAGSAIYIDLTPANIRGRYFGKRESLLLAVGTVFTLVLGRVLDEYRAKDNEYGGFIIVFAVVLLLSLVNLFFWSSIKEPAVKSKKTSFTLRQIVTIPLGNAGFRKIIIFFILYNVGLQVGGPFFSVYMVTGLKLDYTYIMVMSMMSTIVNVILVRVWGRIADSKSWNFVLTYSILLLGIVHLCWGFVNDSTAFILVPLFHIISGAAWAGIGISTFNIQYIYSPENGRTVYTGFNAALGGLMGFLGTMGGSVLLGVFDKMGLHIGSFIISGMQMLFFISGALLVLCSLYAKFCIKQPSIED
jgi:MFS family permease